MNEEDLNEVVLDINGVDEVLALIKKIQSGETVTFPDRIRFGDELSKLVINVKGTTYHSSISGNFARGLGEFQQELYRAVALTTNGVADLRKISKEHYSQYNLVFKVSEGSTELEADVDGFFTTLGKGLSDMSDENKLIAILGIAVIMMAGYALSKLGGKFIGHKTKIAELRSAAEIENKRAEIEAKGLESDAQKEQERTKQIEALVASNKPVKIFSQAMENGAKSIIKNAPDASEAIVGGAVFNRQDILDMGLRGLVWAQTGIFG